MIRTQLFVINGKNSWIILRMLWTEIMIRRANLYIWCNSLSLDTRQRLNRSQWHPHKHNVTISFGCGLFRLKGGIARKTVNTNDWYSHTLRTLKAWGGTVTTLSARRDGKADSASMRKEGGQWQKKKKGHVAPTVWHAFCVFPPKRGPPRDTLRPTRPPVESRRGVLHRERRRGRDRRRRSPRERIRYWPILSNFGCSNLPSVTTQLLVVNANRTKNAPNTDRPTAVRPFRDLAIWQSLGHQRPTDGRAPSRWMACRGDSETGSVRRRRPGTGNNNNNGGGGGYHDRARSP